MMKGEKKSIFSNPVLSTKVKSANVKLFPEGVIGYFIGPTLALLSNSILTSYFNRYMTDVLGINNWGDWAATFFMLLPIVSTIFVVCGNILVGRLMDRNRTIAGKARPLILLAIPLCIIALLVLFVVTPFATETADRSAQVTAVVLIAIGYNLWYALAYPMYYTSHAALVNLSTRNTKDRSLLATISNATSLAAMGLSSMILPYFLGLLFVETDATDANGSAILDQAASYNHWKIFVIALMVLVFIGAVLEFFFTRERISEESFGKNLVQTKKSTPIGKQLKVCARDKFWWIMILFFFMYQLGGMLKNTSISYFCSSHFALNGVYSTANGGTFMGTISIVGAIPTALGMVISWPLSNKIGKGKAILLGAALAVVGGAIGFIKPDNFALVIASFVIKALGSSPAMYLSLALLADVLDHQEAKNGFRTDGLTMTIYGAIMAGMTGIATGILNIVLVNVGYSTSDLSNPALQNASTWLFIGGETICYAVIAITFIAMNVEKFSKQDHAEILERQKAEALAAGEEWIEPAERLRIQEEEAKAASEEARKAELKARCEKKGLSYEDEEAKYQADLKEKQDIKAAKKKAKEDAKAAKDAAKNKDKE